MTEKERNHLSRLEDDIRNLREDVAELKEWTDKMDGGRKALIWFFGFMATIIGSTFAVMRIFSNG